MLFYYPVSAGFDAAEGDELGECHVTPTGYAHMTHMLSGLAGGKLVVALEVSSDLPFQECIIDILLLGWLQSGINIYISVSRYKSTPWLGTSRASSNGCK